MAIIEHAGYYEDPMPGVSHEHFCCELMYITEGELDITAKETYHIYANDLVLIKSSQHHRCDDKCGIPPIHRHDKSVGAEKSACAP